MKSAIVSGDYKIAVSEFQRLFRESELADEGIREAKKHLYNIEQELNDATRQLAEVMRTAGGQAIH